MMAFILFGLFILLVMLRLPIAVALAISSIAVLVHRQRDVRP